METTKQVTVIHTKVLPVGGDWREGLLIAHGLGQLLIALLKTDVYSDVILHDNGELVPGPSYVVIEADGKMHAHVFDTDGDTPDHDEAKRLAHQLVNESINARTLRAHITPYHVCYFTADSFTRE